MNVARRWEYDRTNGPAVIAHRGASSDLAEHTLGAYQRALEVGADGVECDVRVTADGHLVCVHDRRIDRTSTGRGVVSNQTLAQLQQYDFGSWWSEPGDEAPEYDLERNAVLTLDRLLELVIEWPRPVRLLVETKHPSRYGAYVERRVVQSLERFGLARPPRDGSSVVVLMSFSEIAMRRLRGLAPGVPRVLLMERVPVRFKSGFLPYGAQIAGPSVELVRKHPEYVKRLHKSGREAFAWVVDRMDDVDFGVRIGLDALITNRPQSVLRQLVKTGVRRDLQGRPLP